MQGAVRQGRRRRRFRRAGIALVPLAAAVAVAVTVVSIRFSATSPDGPPTDTPRTKGWQTVAESPLSPRGNPTLVQVGEDVVVLGGSETDPCPPTAFCALDPDDLADGAVYDPDRDVWRSITPAPIRLTNISTASSGNSVYVLTHPLSGSGPKQQLWEYSLTEDRWTQMPAPPQPMDSLVSAGTDHLVAYVTAHTKTWTADQSYDIASRTWRSVPRDPLAPSEDRNLIATESGDLVVIAVDRHTQRGKPTWSPWRTAQWNAVTKTWKEVPTPDIVDSGPTWMWVAGRVVNPTTQTIDLGKRLVGTGGIFDPADETWQPVPSAPVGPEGVLPNLDSAGSGRVFVNDQILDVRSGTWTQAPRPPTRFPTQDAAAIIVNDRLIVFGGATFEGSRGTLTNDTWVLPLLATTASPP
ncbi:hypothetical protein LR393_31055 [Kineosporia mesophila]|uniref:hypothetical protein n=1 Tax=Kineosporia mesophila TaxID=566012 RepID=UPI001E3FA748|nr:hypothetical protein [Kineosporia mesophila]MCD5354527.1 hypothetical protein [Kineosporia mesophila]